MYRLPVPRTRPLLLALLVASAAGTTWADMNAGRASAAARYEVERAMCLRGASSQDLDTCLREAGAAYAQARRGAAGDDDAAQLEANRLRRCDPLPSDQRRDCIARMQGQGTTSGSVAGGGIYRELVTTVEEGDDDSGSPEPRR